jgi:hypothetical protein
MIISVINLSKKITDEELQGVIRAINRQISEEFAPYWSLGAKLRLEGNSSAKPEKLTLPDLRGDAVLYLWDKVDVEDALGYHDMNARGIPFGFVFTELAKKLGENWTVTLSHEALELIADPLVNLLVAGPHPQEDRTVFHWYEMSDAVQADTYKCDGIEVSNFVLPLYFTPDSEKGSRNDYLGRSFAGKTLTSFGINRGGYIGFFDPKLDEHVTFANAGDPEAKKRLAIKKQHTAGRRAYRIHGGPRAKPGDIPITPAVRAAARAASTKSGGRYERID